MRHFLIESNITSNYMLNRDQFESFLRPDSKHQVKYPNYKDSTGFSLLIAINKLAKLFRKLFELQCLKSQKKKLLSNRYYYKLLSSNLEEINSNSSEGKFISRTISLNQKYMF